MSVERLNKLLADFLGSVRNMDISAKEAVDHNLIGYKDLEPGIESFMAIHRDMADLYMKGIDYFETLDKVVKDQPLEEILLTKEQNNNAHRRVAMGELMHSITQSMTPMMQFALYIGEEDAAEI